MQRGLRPGDVFSEVFDLKPTNGLYLKNSAHLSNFLTPRTVSTLLNRPGRPSYPIIPYPTGRRFWVAFFQALRARLRSHRPSGTIRNRLQLDAVAKCLP